MSVSLSRGACELSRAAVGWNRARANLLLWWEDPTTEYLATSYLNRVSRTFPGALNSVPGGVLPTVTRRLMNFQAVGWMAAVQLAKWKRDIEKSPGNCRYNVPRTSGNRLSPVPKFLSKVLTSSCQLLTTFNKFVLCSPLWPVFLHFLKSSIFCIIIAILCFFCFFFFFFLSLFGHQTCWEKVCPRLDARADTALLSPNATVASWTTHIPNS